MPKNTKFIRVDSLNSNYFLDCVDLLERSFACAEIRSLVKFMNEENYYPMAVVDNKGNFLGCATMFRNLKINYLYLAYFAVLPDARGIGIGSKIFEMIKSFAKELNCKGVYWEVLEPDSLENKEAVDFSERRIDFYKRQGGSLIEGESISYKLPEINQDVFYKIMFISFDKKADVPDFISCFE